MAKGGKRSGAGRPSTGRTKELRLYVTPEADEKLSAIAQSRKVSKGQIVEEFMSDIDVKTLGKLVDAIVDTNETLTIYTMPNLAAKMQLACEYFNLVRKDLERFDGKTAAYFNLVDCFTRLEDSQPLPLVDLLDELDDLIRAIRKLEEFCGIFHESLHPVDMQH
ncbi:hypothetical protein [Allocoleopsis sp.]|uniref:hypothetical protein n=1 Tax=Allocoleopsis sp. TaxID=3088169 RepID=UPI002FD3A33F